MAMPELSDMQKALGRQLLRGGVKPRFVHRTLTELQQHYEDLQEQYLAEGMSQADAAARAQESLGDRQAIAQAVLSRPELRSWSFRFPWAVYLLSPLLVFLFMFVATLAVITITVSQYEGMGVAGMPRWLPPLADLLIQLNSYLLAPLVVAAFCLAARNRMMSMTWPVAGIALLAFVSAGQTVSTVWPLTPDEIGSISISWGYRFLGVPVSWEQTAGSTVRLFVTLLFAAGVYFFWPGRERELTHR